MNFKNELQVGLSAAALRAFVDCPQQFVPESFSYECVNVHVSSSGVTSIAVLYCSPARQVHLHIRFCSFPLACHAAAVLNTVAT